MKELATLQMGRAYKTDDRAYYGDCLTQALLLTCK